MQLRTIAVLVSASIASFASGSVTPASAQERPPRAIRREIPMTASIQRAHAAGTRDRSGRPGPNYWQLRTDFKIRARIDETTGTLHGSETILVHNDSPDDLRELVLRLDHNVFRGDVPRGSSVPAETTDGMVVTRVAVDGQEIDLGSRRGRGARAFNLDQTVGVVRPANPIAAGGKATLEIDWSTRLPGGPGGQGHRMTQRWEDYLFQPTQWFPRLAKYDDLRGWERNVYLGPAEFYNNFGSFDVELDVPEGWITTATGTLANAEDVLTDRTLERIEQALTTDDETWIVSLEELGTGLLPGRDGRQVWRYTADLVNDFAWATSDRYLWRATRATIPGRGPIPIHMVFVPERERLFERAGDISRHALEFYSDLWAPYPFPQLTLQDGPSAGMEYPMVINSNQGAADHEVAHQWWPMMLGTNETRYGWMDEGLNTYMNILSDAHAQGQAPNLDGRGQSYGNWSGNEDEPPMMWSANYGGPLYGFQTYVKAPMMLSMLGGIHGDEAVQEAIRGYTNAWAFKHPSPWDFAFFVERALDADLGWFWYAWLFSTEAVNGSIERVEARDGGTVVHVHQAGEMPSPVVLRVVLIHGEELGELPGDCTVTRSDDGAYELRWPVDVWFDGRRTFEAELPCAPESLASVTFDPGGRFPDDDPSDNVWPR